MENNKNVLLSVKDLRVSYKLGADIVYAVNGVSFELEKGTTLGLVGETGAGKTTIAKALMQILPDHSLNKSTGEVIFEGKDLMQLSNNEMRFYRGSKMSMIFQDPMTALNPVQKVSRQIAECFRLHQNMSKQEANIQAIKMLEMVGISRDRADEYPHQFSGGMKQRVCIAIALACKPDLLIADEPTTALDVTIQAQVMDLIRELKDSLGTSMILITHDLGIVAGTCDNVAVVYAGEIIERGSKEDIFDHPSHPYTIGLFGALPDISKDMKRLSPIEGLPPDPTVEYTSSCPFAARCPKAQPECSSRKPEMREISDGHYVACLLV